MVEERQRLDKWLWVSRFYKSRSLATAAVNGGKVQCNGERGKPGKAIKVGDTLSIRKGIMAYELTVLGLSQRRVSAVEAQELYSESDSSIAQREQRQQQYQAERMATPVSYSRPNKRERRKLLSVKKSKSY